MFTIKTIDVIFRVEASVHNKLGLTEAKYIKIFQKMFNCFGIRYVAGKFTVIEREPWFFSENQQQVKLWELIIFLVLTILYLGKGFWITWYTGTVICPVFIVNAPFALQPEELIYLFIRNGWEELTASGRTDIGTIRCLWVKFHFSKRYSGLLSSSIR